MNYRVISYVLGCILNIEAVAMLLPLICSFAYGENTKWVFMLCIFICLAFGFLLTRIKPKSREIFAKEGFVIVALTWITISLFGALPFVISKSIPNFVDAFFETVSGFTTTGASILSDVENLPKSILMWRSFTHWLGGMGVIVFLVALLPLLDGGSIHLIKAESTGPAVGKLVPKVKTTAKILYLIYICFTVLQIILLLLGGLDWFDSLTLTFATAGTGGFSVKNLGLAPYSSYTQVVITIFMIIFGVDFSFYYLILIKKFKSVLKMEEVRYYFIIFAVATILIFFNTRGMYQSGAETLKHSAFQVASIITTTGFSTVNYDLWPEFSKLILLFLTFSGACAGSTAGGIKISRIIILFKTIVKEVKVLTHPKSVVKVRMNGRIVEHETLRVVNVFFISYAMIFAFFLLMISFEGFDFLTSFSTVLTMLGNVGPGLAKVGPTCNFSIYSDFSTVLLSVAMLLGRLEIFPVLILLSPKTWKK